MPKVKIGILREGKVPIDRRVPFTPLQAAELVRTFPEIKLLVQRSDIRCFSDQEYKSEGVEVVDSVNECDILFGVKEVPVHELIPGKTYFFFSHTIKKQPYNRSLLQSIVKDKIRLIDYEILTNDQGQRIVAFGRWAGIVGAYNGILTYGKKHHLFDLRRAHECHDLEDLKSEFQKAKLPPVKIVVTGGGRVSQGAMEVLKGMNIEQVTPDNFLHKEFSNPVFTQLNPEDYNRHKDQREFDLKDFFSSPENYLGQFSEYTKNADILIAAAYWDPRSPVLFTKNDMLDPEFKIDVIADITCDIEGSIPSTKKASTIDDPVYDYNPKRDQLEAAFSNEKNVSVMAVDNLPCELPRDASASFGKELTKNVIPHLLLGDKEGVIARATITENGMLTKKYAYLQDYLEGKS